MLNQYDQLIQDIWNAKDTYLEIIPNDKYDFNAYAGKLADEIRQYCRENNIPLDTSTLARF
mgnify:CR=1 FL=1